MSVVFNDLIIQEKGPQRDPQWTVFYLSFRIIKRIYSCPFNLDKGNCTWILIGVSSTCLLDIVGVKCFHANEP